MGKTIRLDAKYPNELTKHSQNSEKITRNQKQSGKLSPLSKKSKRYLKGNFLQRIWPLVNEKKKGHKI